MKLNYLLGEDNIRIEEREYINKRLEKIRKFISDCKEDEIIADIEIRTDEKNFWVIEIILRTPHYKYIAKKSAAKLIDAADQIEGALKRQIVETKERMKSLRQRGGRSIKKKFSIDKKARF